MSEKEKEFFTRTKFIIAVSIVLISIVLSVVITKGALAYMDQEIATKIAVEQMTNSDTAAVEYEAYRNMRNSVNTHLPAIIIFAGISISLSYVLISTRKRNTKNSEDVTDDLVVEDLDE